MSDEGWFWPIMAAAVLAIATGGIGWAVAHPTRDHSGWARQCRETCADRGVLSMTETECRCGGCP